MSTGKKNRFCCISQVNSTVEQIDISASEDALHTELGRWGTKKATVILWQMNAVRFGTWDGHAFSFPAHAPLQMELLIELRIFNEQGELYLRCEDGQFVGRLRTDEAGTEVDYVDTIARFWGGHTKGAAEDADWMTLRDPSRKLELELPAVEGKPEFVGLVMRSYIGVDNETGQAGYIDHRYYAIESADMEVYDGQEK
jgi:CRISPR-associated protein, TIGR03984 family